MKNKPKTKLGRAVISSKRIDALYKSISGYVRTAKQNILYSVNTEQVKTYWLIGRDIVEEEQRGKNRAEYGTFLLHEISSRLTSEFGIGFGVDTVEQARKFYLVYKISDAARRKFEVPIFKPNLSWTHYRSLMRVENSIARAFYEQEATINNWATRQLNRQIHSLLFERLAKSKDKKGLMRLACKGQELIKPEDAIKDPVVLEFLNLPASHKLVESKLEDALISNMQNFLLELGKGVRHEVAPKSCFRESRKPFMSLDESTGMNKELPRQCDEMLLSMGKELRDKFPSGNHNRISR